MRYLTPELYVNVNQAKDHQVERLYEQWNVAGARAREHLREVKDKLPPKMQQFHDAFCLHDAEIVNISVSSGHNGTRTPVAMISVRQNTQLIWLVYDLCSEPKITTPVASDVFVKDTDRRQWLYDEIELLDEAHYRHEILLNTGEVVELTFVQFDMFIHYSPGQTPQMHAASSAEGTRSGSAL